MSILKKSEPDEIRREDDLLECEKLWTFAMMMAVGGFFGAYTYTVRGGVFCNAQTANFVLLSMQIGTLNWSGALYYLIPISAYLLGTVISEILPKAINRANILRWDTFFVAFEMIAVLILGFVPDSAPFQICQVSINFIAAMQFNTFRQAQKIPMATTFCTNHLRQTGVHLVKWLRNKSISARNRFLMHFVMLLAFVGGGIFAAILCVFFSGKAIWGAEILLIIVFVDLLYADLVTEKNSLNKVPHGH